MDLILKIFTVIVMMICLLLLANYFLSMVFTNPGVKRIALHITAAFIGWKLADFFPLKNPKRNG